MLQYARESGVKTIEIHAHAHLQRYYERHGFRYIRDVEIVGGHQLVEMLLSN